VTTYLWYGSFTILLPERSFFAKKEEIEASKVRILLCKPEVEASRPVSSGSDYFASHHAHAS
jgi:hypothetical protein